MFLIAQLEVVKNRYDDLIMNMILLCYTQYRFAFLRIVIAIQIYFENLAKCLLIALCTYLTNTIFTELLLTSNVPSEEIYKVGNSLMMPTE